MASPAKTTRRGRRQGEPVSRETVLQAAKRQFAINGYEKTTLRAIARDAHVDPSMVLYLFGSKEELFRESLRLIMDPEVLVAALAEGDGDIGTRMVRMYLRIWETPDTAASMRAMLQSATSNADAHEAFRGFMQSYVLPAVSDALGGGEQARLRGMLAGSQLVGVAMLRYVMQIPPLATLSGDELERLIAPTLTRYLTADASELGLPDLQAVNPLVQHQDTDDDQDHGH
jgi:AcrR family transcriptional regulator